MLLSFVLCPLSFVLCRLSAVCLRFFRSQLPGVRTWLIEVSDQANVLPTRIHNPEFAIYITLTGSISIITELGGIPWSSQ
jgi:hypothetical protein